MNFLKNKTTIAVAVAAAALAATAGTAAAATTTTTAASSVPRCTTGNLSASLHGRETAKGGWVGYILTLTNEGAGSCSVYGYPGLGLQNAQHHTVSSHVAWGSTVFDANQGRELIVLSPGETASASFAYRTGTSKDSVNASYLEITPPNEVAHAVVKLSAPIYHGDLYVTSMATHTPHP